MSLHVTGILPSSLDPCLHWLLQVSSDPFFRGRKQAPCLTCAIGSVCCPHPTCPSACGSMLETSLHGTHSCTPLGRSSPALPPPAWPSGRCSHQEKANKGFLGHPTTDYWKNAAQIKYILSATDDQISFLGKFGRQFGNQMLEFEIIPCCFFCNPYTGISRTILGCLIIL